MYKRKIRETNNEYNENINYYKLILIFSWTAGTKFFFLNIKIKKAQQIN